MHSFRRQTNNIQVTSIDRFSDIISVCIRNEIFRLGFFGSIIELTHMGGHHKIEALTTIIFAAAWQAVKANVGQYCFVNVPMQHPSADGPFRWALLSHRFLSNKTSCRSNPEPEEGAHFSTVTRYLKGSRNYIMSYVVVCCDFSLRLFFFSSFQALVYG